MSLDNSRINILWNELKSLGPAFLIDKGHDFGSERTGEEDKPSGFNDKGQSKAGAKFLARFCTLLCSAFVHDFPPDDSTGEIVWSNQEIIYYTSPVYALLWSASKAHSIDPFFKNSDTVYLKKYSIRLGACKSTPGAYPFKDDFFKDHGPAKAMKKAALPTSVAGNPCKYDDQWKTNRMGIARQNTRQIEFLVGPEGNEMKAMNGPNTTKITGGIWRGKKSNVTANKIVISDSPVRRQANLKDKLIKNNKLKTGTSSFLDAAPSTKGEQKVYGITYNMPFLAATQGGNKFYINVEVSNNDGEGEIFDENPYYTLVFSLWTKQSTRNWTKVVDSEYTLNIQEAVKLFPGEVSLLGCLINTLVNRNSESPTAGQKYQWDNVKTIINSMTNPINPIQRLIKQEEILANLIRIAKVYAETIGGSVRKKVQFVFAFIMQIKTMGDFSSLKDCQWLEEKYGKKCFIFTKDQFLRKIVNPFYQGYRGKLVGDSNLESESPYFKDPAFTIRREAEPQTGGAKDQYNENPPIDIDALNKSLNNTHSGVCDRVLASTAGLYDDPGDFCSFKYGQMKDINEAIANMNPQNIYNNLQFEAPLPVVDVYANYDATISSDMGGGLHEALFGNYLKFSGEEYISKKNIWNFSRQPTFFQQTTRTTEEREDFPDALPEDFYINLTDTIGDEELVGIVRIFNDNYPNDYYLQESSQAFVRNAGIKNFTNSINYLFIRAWQFRQYALQQCRTHVPIGEAAIAHMDPCVFPVDMLLDQKRWFNHYFTDKEEGPYPYWPTEEGYNMVDIVENDDIQNKGKKRKNQRSKSKPRRKLKGTLRRRARSHSSSSPGASSSRQGGGTRRKKRKKKRTKLRKKKNRKTKRRRKKKKKTRRRR